MRIHERDNQLIWEEYNKPQSKEELNQEYMDGLKKIKEEIPKEDFTTIMFAQMFLTMRNYMRTTNVDLENMSNDEVIKMARELTNSYSSIDELY
jgi:hypothetical protein